MYVGVNGRLRTILFQQPDREGNTLSIERLLIEGSVDTSKVGTYQVNYSVVSDEKVANPAAV